MGRILFFDEKFLGNIKFIQQFGHIKQVKNIIIYDISNYMGAQILKEKV